MPTHFLLRNMASRGRNAGVMVVYCLCYIISRSSANTKHLYNICTTSAQRLRRWSNIAQMLYKCFVFTGILCRPTMCPARLPCRADMSHSRYHGYSASVHTESSPTVWSLPRHSPGVPAISAEHCTFLGNRILPTLNTELKTSAEHVCCQHTKWTREAITKSAYFFNQPRRL